MDLREFVSRALTDIIDGVKEAQSKTQPGTIIPRVSSRYKSIETGISELSPIEFEVSVRADEQSGAEGRLSVVAVVIGGGVKGENKSSLEHSARLSFRVPVRFPVSEQEPRTESD